MRALVLALLLPVPALSEGRPVLPAPESCTPVLTVRKTGCAVEHVYRCDGGRMLNVVVRKAGTKRATTLYDADYINLMSDLGPDGAALYGAPQGEIALSDVIATGLGSATQIIAVWSPTFVDPFRGTITYKMEVTDRNAEVDGVQLIQMRIGGEMVLNGGAMQFSVEGNGYFDPASQAAFMGADETKAFGTILEKHDEDPVALIYPGEPGFMNDPSETDCEPVSSLSRDPADAGGRG